MYTICSVSHQTTWDRIDLEVMRRFLQGCQLDFCEREQMNRMTMYLANGRMSYLRRSPHWKSVFKPLLEQWHRECASRLILSQE